MPVLDSNEDVHADPCGEYVLECLQRGVNCDEVAKDILDKFLVLSTGTRLLAYRRYREQQAGYWSVDALERLHWKLLYKEGAALESVPKSWKPNGAVARIRARLCESLQLSE